MARTISIGAQGFENLRTNDYFYVDKTGFVRDWWRAGDDVTLVCRPRRSGKTLNLDTVRCFFSAEYAGRGEELFGGLAVWDDPGLRALQGTLPVISLSFSTVKNRGYEASLADMKQVLSNAFHAHDYLVGSDALSPLEREDFVRVRPDMSDTVASNCLNQLCTMLRKHWGAGPLVLLDEYDAPMQEAWLGGWWDDMVAFQRALFNATFKTNPSLGRALITGVTRVSRESIFSDLNNLEICSMRVTKYETAFGFTEAEVLASLEEFGMAGDAERVEEWYDGFVVGDTDRLYNPWSITRHLESRTFDTFWANTSGNGLVSSVVRAGDADLKRDFEVLLQGGTVSKQVDEQVVFSELAWKPGAAWGMLVASGYVKALPPAPVFVRDPRELKITNYETRLAFDDMVRSWFEPAEGSYGLFAQALLAGDARMMTRFLGEALLACASSFDGGKSASEHSEPERFYHGLVLGLLVELRGRYAVESNRESGFGRYDVMLVPTCGPAGPDPAIVIEFKVFDDYDEQTLADTVARAHAQIEAKAYATALAERGFAPERIRTWGMAFRGKECLVG